ncbi:MAG: LPS assembly protein LptD [Deltaproteobacteria bacterium]|nr:LPS assembly protein LptD [Deltaproteobacteria bacterium]
MGRIILCLILILAAGIRGAPAADIISAGKGPVSIEAARMTYHSERKVYEAEGDVVITFQGGTLRADRVVFDNVTQEAEARGHVVAVSEGDTLEGEHLRFNVETKTGILDGGTLFIKKNHFYLQAEEIAKRGDASYTFREARATTCDGPLPDWRFTGAEADVTIDGYGTLKRGTFQVRDVPVLYVPYLIFPAKTTRQTGFLFPRIAYSSNDLGWDVGIPFYWAVGDSADATFYQRYMDKRGFQEGAEFRYCLSKGNFGTIYGDYLNDTKEIIESEEDGLSRNWRENNRRWSYYISHESQLPAGISLRADLAKVSDIWYFRDFDSYNYYLDHRGEGTFERVSFSADRSLAALDSKVRLVKEWRFFNLMALAQYTDNLQSYTNDDTLQRYPEVTFTAIRQPIFQTPVNIELESRYDNFYRTAGYRGHLFDHHPVFSLPLRYGSYLQFTPKMELRFTRWDASVNPDDTQATNTSRKMYSFGGELSTEVSRIFDVKIGAAEKIRHVVKPEFTYTYTPYVFQDDRPDFVPEIPEQNSLTYALSNILTARYTDDDGTVKYREFLSLTLSQTYDILEARKDPAIPADTRRPFGQIGMEMECNPVKYFSLDADTKYDVNSGEWKVINSRCGLSDWRDDTLSVEYRYTQNSVEEVNLSLLAKISELVDFGYVLRKNLLDAQYLETRYSIDYHRQCWSVNASYADADNDRQFMVIFSLYGLGKVGKISATPAEW